MDNQIDNLVISITASADNAARNIDRFTNAIRPMGAAAKSAAGGMATFDNSVKNVAQQAQRTSESVEDLGKNVDGVKRSLYTPARASIFAALKSDADVLSMKLNAARAKLADLLNADEPNQGAIANATAEVRRLTDAYAKAKKAADDAGKGMEDSGKSADKASQGIAKYWNALKRVAFYRVVRSIIRGITDAFRTGITNMYQWSKVMDGTFAKSMDRIATSTLYLKNSLGAMLAPIINTLAPIIDKVIDGIVAIINWVNKLFAMLSGSQTYTVAKKVATTWQDAGKDAAKSAKSAADDIKRTILGFDEINKLEKQNTSSGSGGSGSGNSGTNYSDMFETRKLEGWMLTVANFIDRFNLGWAGVLAGILGGLAAIKLAIAALKTPIGAVTKLAKAFIGTLVGKTIKLGVSLVRKGWETLKGWALSFGEAVVDLAVKIKTSVAQLWWEFSRAWNGLHPVLQVGIITSITATALWLAFRAGWFDDISEKVLGVRISTTPAEEIWEAIKSKFNEVKETLTLDVQPNVSTGGASSATKPTWKGVEIPEELPGDQDVLTWTKLFGNIHLPKFDFSSLKKNVHDISGKLLPVLLLAVGVGAAASGLPGLGANANALLLTDQNKLKSQVKKMPTNAAALAYGSKNPLTNRDAVKLSPLYGMSDAAIQKAKQFASAIVSNMGTVKTTISDTIDTSKTVLGGMATLIEQAARDSQNVSWEPVGRNITQTLSKGETQSFPEAKAKFNRDMEALRNSGYTYSYDAVGKYIVSTLTTGIDTDKWKPIKSVLDMAWSMFNKKEEVPWITFGNEIPQEVSNGVNNNKSWAVQAAVDLGFAMYNAMNGVSFWDIGYNIIADVYNGFVNNTSWLANTLANTAKGLYNIMSGKTAVIATSTTTSRKTTVSNAKKPTKSAKAKSLGGILSNGIWTDIPQFANGTLSAGSLFWAGEAGPEIVGHVGGRTEVLNKSQLASAIYSAVQSAMAPAASNFAAAASSMRNPDAWHADYETLLMYIQQGNDATMRQNELLRQQNDYLRSINDKEWTAELTTAAVQRSLNRSNLRAGTTVVPVG